MQATNSWSNKNKPGSSTNVVQTVAANSGTTNNTRAQRVGTSALRSQSKDRRMPPNKGRKNPDKGGTDGGSGGSGINNSTSFNLAGSFNSNDLIQGFNS
jgi:hypothetical protein